jgi:hypothetical protein
MVRDCTRVINFKGETTIFRKVKFALDFSLAICCALIDGAQIDRHILLFACFRPAPSSACKVTRHETSSISSGSNTPPDRPLQRSCLTRSLKCEKERKKNFLSDGDWSFRALTETCIRVRLMAPHSKAHI